MDRWWHYGNCSNTPELKYLFFSNDRQEKRIAKEICKTCPVKAECFEDSLGSQGIWAGLEEEQRANLWALWGFPTGEHLHDLLSMRFQKSEPEIHIETQGIQDTAKSASLRLHSSILVEDTGRLKVVYHSLRLSVRLGA